MIKSCSFDGCPGLSVARGLCNTHYMQNRRAGLLPVGTRARGTVEVRFWRFVDKTENCWYWTGRSRSKKGYGNISAGARDANHKLAHRLSYEIHKGAIPVGMVVMHTCDNPSCVNPDHLVVGTQSENILDSFRKGRKISIPPHKQGEEHGASKLNNELVKLIRASTDSIKSLSIFYGVSLSSIERVLNRKTWKHIA